MAAETQPAAAKDRTPTAYHVLRFIGDGPATPAVTLKAELVGENITAPNSEAAIRTYAENAGDDARGTYVAVPARSWRPTKVTPETTTTLKIGSA